jgi:Bacterial Ig-like domain (group 3)
MESSGNTSRTSLDDLIDITDKLETQIRDFKLSGPRVSGSLARGGFIVAPPKTSGTALADLEVTPNPGTVGTNTVFVCNVLSLDSDAVPTGTITLSINGLTYALVNGTVTVSLAVLGGTYAVSFTYNGDGDFAPTDSNIVLLSIGTVVPTISFITVPDPVLPLTPFDITLTVAGPGGSPIPTGNVKLIFDVLVGAIQALDGSGQATYSISFYYIGSWNVHIEYYGDSNYSPTTYDQIVTISPQPNTCTLSALVNPITFGSIETFGISVTGSGPTPTGTVELFINGVSQGTLTLVSGAGAYLVSMTNLGLNTCVFNYYGDGYYAANTSNTVIVNVV